MAVYDISVLSYDNLSGSFTAEDTSSYGGSFNNDGTKFYMVGDSGNDINQYSLSTAYNPATMTYVQNRSVATEDTTPCGVMFNPTGTKMYVCGFLNKKIFEYSLSGSWNILTTTYTGAVSGSLALTIDTSNWQACFNGTGTKIYYVGYAHNGVYCYSLPIAYALSGATFLNSGSLSLQEDTPLALAFNNDGTKFYMAGQNTNRIHQYSCGTPYDISTLTYDLSGALTASSVGVPRGMMFNNDGTKVFIVDSNPDGLFRYSCGVIEEDAHTSINIGDEWKIISGVNVLQINIGDTWKAVSGAQINIGDAWKNITLS